MLKNILKKFFVVILELAVIVGVLWFIAQKKGIQNPAQIIPTIKQNALSLAKNNQSVTQKSLPTPTQPKNLSFVWQYKGVKYSLNETLYKSTYDFYNSQPKTYSYVGSLPSNWEDEYYGMFLNQNQNDGTIAQLSKALQDLGRQHKLSDDQTVDLTMAFVQSITYDDARAKEILSKDGNVQMQYPYETLFRGSGVCSDKSLLAAAILRSMGYGVALFAYEQDNHMAIGIKCPQNYSTYGSGYCYAETTSPGNKIGIIPSLDSATNKTIDANQLSALSLEQNQQIKLQQLGQVTIFQKTDGREYQEISQTFKLNSQIDGLKSAITNGLSDIQSQQLKIKQEQSDLNGMQDDLNRYMSQQNVDKYNLLASKYNDLLDQYKKDVKNFNKNVTLYNQTIERYNELIAQ